MENIETTETTAAETTAAETTAAETTAAETTAAETTAAEQLAYNQVKLSDGRIVEMREQIGSDEMIVAGQLGEVFTANGAGAVIYQSCLITRCIVSVGGVATPKMREYGDVRDFLAQFKAKDWNKMKKLYEKVNADDAEGNA